MLHGTTNPGVAGSELNRLLVHLASLADPADAPPAASRPAFAERLGHWLSWSGAITLSAALSSAPRAVAPGPLRATGAEAADVRRVRAALAASIAAGPDKRSDPGSSPTDFAPYRRHCGACQQAMQDAVSALRQRLREALSRQSAQGAQLAAIDAVLDQTLAVRERSLLGLVPLRLQAHFERLQGAAPDGDTRWTASFRNDMTRVLTAELDHRLLPAQGLLDSLIDSPNHGSSGQRPT